MRLLISFSRVTAVAWTYSTGLIRRGGADIFVSVLMVRERRSVLLTEAWEEPWAFCRCPSPGGVGGSLLFPLCGESHKACGIWSNAVPAHVDTIACVCPLFSWHGVERQVTSRCWPGLNVRGTCPSSPCVVFPVCCWIPSAQTYQGFLHLRSPGMQVWFSFLKVSLVLHLRSCWL